MSITGDGGVRLGVLGAALALVLLGAACFGGDDPEPEPTATQAALATAAPAPASTPTPAPTPRPTPAPTPAPASGPAPTAEAAPASAAPLDDLVVTSSTTGQDLVDRLSEEERECLRSTFGDVFFGILLQTPLLGAGSDPAAAAPLFGCLAVDSIVALGLAFISAQAGGWDAETRACMIGVGREHPEAVLVGIGMQVVDAARTAAARTATLAIYGCLAAEEKAAFLLRLQALIDAQTSAERDLVAALPEAEAACIRENLTATEYQSLLASTVHGAFGVSDAVSECVTEEGYAAAFLAVSEATMGPLSADSRSCLDDFAAGHPRYTALANPEASDTSSVSAGELAEVADDGTRTWDCLTDEELQRSHSLSLGALAAAP